MSDNTNKIGHLNMIQETIKRMGSNSFYLKEWSVGIMIAIYSFASNDEHKSVVITVIPLIVFWLLDTYYLTLERKYRCLYENVRKMDEKDIDFDMSLENIEIKMNQLEKYCFFKIAFSKTILSFYLVCILTTIIIYMF